MWDFLKYFEIARRLFTLFGNLKAVRARDPETTAADYGPAADAIAGDMKVEKWLSERTEEEKAAFMAGLPVVLFGIDAMIE